ncbi:hypothetical protein Catovirus_1_904 [Catovirus CTV1]|uniref:Uncharacterized protein n=1 Tax=Catovirus CTV1 TaxID=1977631 RepID=A0A1V0SB10_9VIRU|nr:hypothetical protein Catovirus_1_904 [Catovirus CTV1]
MSLLSATKLVNQGEKRPIMPTQQYNISNLFTNQKNNSTIDQVENNIDIVEYYKNKYNNNTYFKESTINLENNNFIVSNYAPVQELKHKTQIKYNF